MMVRLPPLPKLRGVDTFYVVMIAVLLMVFIAGMTVAVAKPLLPSLGQMMKMDKDNHLLDKDRSLAYIRARQREVKGLPRSRVIWVQTRNKKCYDREAGTINIVLLNAMLKDRIAYINSIPAKGEAH